MVDKKITKTLKHTNEQQARLEVPHSGFKLKALSDFVTFKKRRNPEHLFYD